MDALAPIRRVGFRIEWRGGSCGKEGHRRRKARSAGLTAIPVAAFVFAACGAIAEQFPGAAPIAQGHPNLPNGYELAAHFVCGAGPNNVEGNGAVITLTRGAQRALPSDAAPMTGEAYDADRVEFAISGLDPAVEYAIGFAWWDRDRAGRKQSVEFGAGAPAAWNVVLPPTVPLAFHGDQPTFARIQLPVPPKTDRLSVAFAKSSGPGVVVNELWVLRKTGTQPRKRVVIVTGDDWTGHSWRATGPELAGILREDPRLEVWIVESPAIFASPLLDRFDAAVIHFKDYAERLPLGGDVWDGLDRYAATGHGLVIAHFGCGAFQEWPGYVNVAGRVWDPKKRGHDPYGPFRVRVTDGAHPVSQGMADFDTGDELYTCLFGDPKIRVLYTATSRVDKQDYPMGFVVEETGGRIFHSSLGHDAASLRHPGTRDLYRRAAAWAAGLAPGAK
ncbi:MAG: ThuA domain-containing protein [Candidatus Hydrogenedentes bacterium]|nr:ThuA domain-containing protein [Candidatus Hydrogenedentota bacterium]